jgi:hypothetical protein
LTNFIVFSSVSLSLFVAKLALDKGNICNSKKANISFSSTCCSLSLPMSVCPYILAQLSDFQSKNSVGSAVSEVIVVEAKERKSSFF